MEEDKKNSGMTPTISTKSKKFLIDLCDHVHVHVDGEVVRKFTPCWGYFDKPKSNEVLINGKQPLAIFRPTEPYGYNVWFYTREEIINAIKAEIS